VKIAFADVMVLRELRGPDKLRGLRLGQRCRALTRGFRTSLSAVQRISEERYIGFQALGIEILNLPRWDVVQPRGFRRNCTSHSNPCRALSTDHPPRMELAKIPEAQQWGVK
jgi:hypothetical protein